MKIIRITTAWTLGMLGTLFAGSQLLHAAELRGDRASSLVPTVDPSNVRGLTIATLSDNEKNLYRGEIERFRGQYGDEMANRLVFMPRDGRLKIVGVQIDAKEDGEGGSQGPSCT